jgi:hypothetical protein
LLLHKHIARKTWVDCKEAADDLIAKLKQEIIKVVEWLTNLYRNGKARNAVKPSKTILKN